MCSASSEAVPSNYRFGQLDAVDTEGVEPVLRASIDQANVLRADAPRIFENRHADEARSRLAISFAQCAEDWICQPVCEKVVAVSSTTQLLSNTLSQGKTDL